MSVVIPIGAGGPDLGPIEARLTNLEDNEKLVTYFEVVSGASSGNQVTIPTNGSIVLDKFGASKDAVLSQVDGNGNPTWSSPKDSSGNVVTSTMDSSGNYIFSSTPVDSNVAIIYIFKIKQIYWSNVDLDFVAQETENIPLTAKNTITVAKQGGHFTTIEEALDSITDSSSSNRYTILVSPGIYAENNPLQIKKWVTIESIGIHSVVVIPNNSTEDLFLADKFGHIIGLVLDGVGLGKYALSHTVEGEFLMDNCVIKDCSNGVYVNHISASIEIYTCAVNTPIAPTVYGIRVESGTVSLDNLQVRQSGDVQTILSLTGQNTLATLNSLTSLSPNVEKGIHIQDLARVVANSISLANMTDGIVLDGGSNFRAVGVNIFLAQQDGVRIDDIGTNTLWTCNACTIENSGRYDINFLSSTAIGTGIGSTSIDKLNFVSGAQLYGAIIDTKEGDEGFNVIGELHVGLPEQGTESVFGKGDSYTRGMLVYTETAGNVFTDITEEASSASLSTFSFPGTGVDNAIYVASSLQDNTDYILHHGIKYAVETAGDLGSGNIVSEYWNGSAWIEVNSMSTDGGIPFLPHGKDYFSRLGGFQLRYDVVRMNDSTWVKNDPVSLGTSYYWVRYRVSSIVAAVPIFQQFKLHPPRSEFNSDGFLEFFGDARPYAQLPITVGSGKPIQGNMQSQTIWLDADVGVGSQQNRFTATGDVYGWEIISPNNIDTSSEMAFRIAGRPSSTGSITFTIRMSWISPNGTVYTSEPSGGTNPNTTSQTVTKSVVAGEISWFEGYVDISNAIARRDEGFPDFMIITIQPSTMSGNFDLMGVQAYYLVWSNGGHAD